MFAIGWSTSWLLSSFYWSMCSRLFNKQYHYSIIRHALCGFMSMDRKRVWNDMKFFEIYMDREKRTLFVIELSSHQDHRMSSYCAQIREWSHFRDIDKINEHIKHIDISETRIITIWLTNEQYINIISSIMIILTMCDENDESTSHSFIAFLD